MALTKAQRALRADWIAALRSGEYAQTTGVLMKRGVGAGFCCLGVACDIVDPDRWESGGAALGIHWDGAFTNLHDEVRGALGLSWGDSDALIGMNDVDRCTFEEIADAIDFLTRAGL